MKQLICKKEFTHQIPDISGDFLHAATLDFDKKMQGKCFWVFNEANRDLYYTFNSQRYGTKNCGHYLDGQPDELSGYIKWFPRHGAYLCVESENSKYFRPLGWHDGVYLMENCEYGVVEVLIASEKEAFYRADNQKVYAAIDFIRQANERFKKEPIPSEKDQKNHWLRCLIAEVICLIVMAIPFALQIAPLFIFTAVGAIAGIIIIPIRFSLKYSQMKWLARGRYFDESK